MPQWNMPVIAYYNCIDLSMKKLEVQCTTSFFIVSVQSRAYCIVVYIKENIYFASTNNLCHRFCILTKIAKDLNTDGEKSTYLNIFLY